MAKSLHGDMEQKQREEAIKAFKTSKLRNTNCKQMLQQEDLMLMM